MKNSILGSRYFNLVVMTGVFVTLSLMVNAHFAYGLSNLQLDLHQQHYMDVRADLGDQLDTVLRLDSDRRVDYDLRLNLDRRVDGDLRLNLDRRVDRGEHVSIDALRLRYLNVLQVDNLHNA